MNGDSPSRQELASKILELQECFARGRWPGTMDQLGDSLADFSVREWRTPYGPDRRPFAQVIVSLPLILKWKLQTNYKPAQWTFCIRLDQAFKEARQRRWDVEWRTPWALPGQVDGLPCAMITARETPRDNDVEMMYIECHRDVLSEYLKGLVNFLVTDGLTLDEVPEDDKGNQADQPVCPGEIPATMSYDERGVDLVALAARVAREVGVIERQRGPEADHAGEAGDEGSEELTCVGEAAGLGEHRPKAAGAQLGPDQQAQTDDQQKGRAELLPKADRLDAVKAEGKTEEVTPFCLALGVDGERFLTRRQYQAELDQRSQYGLFIDLVEQFKPCKQMRCRASGFHADGELRSFDIAPEYARILARIASASGKYVSEGMLESQVDYPGKQLGRIKKTLKDKLQIDVLKIKTEDKVSAACFLLTLSRGFLFLLPLGED